MDQLYRGQANFWCSGWNWNPIQLSPGETLRFIYVPRSSWPISPYPYHQPQAFFGDVDVEQFNGRGGDLIPKSYPIQFQQGKQQAATSQQPAQPGRNRYNAGRNAVGSRFLKLDKKPVSNEDRMNNLSISNNSKHCPFCKKNGERFKFYTSHSLKDEAGNTTCPILCAYTCPRCNATGAKGHSESHCPLLTATEKAKKLSQFKKIYGHACKG